MSSRNLQRIAAVLTAISLVLILLLRRPLAGAPFVVAAIVFWFWSALRKGTERL